MTRGQDCFPQPDQRRNEWSGFHGEAGEALWVHRLNILSVEADFHGRGQRNLNLLGGCPLSQVP